MAHALVALGALFALVAAPNAASAAPSCGDDATQSPRDRAIDCHRKGTEAYDRAAFRDAVALFERARSLYPQPNMLWNMARACELLADQTPDRSETSAAQHAQKLRDLDCAAGSYTAYVQEDPGAAGLSVVRARIAALRERIRVLSAPPPAPPPPAPSPAPWIVAGVGALGAATGGVLWAVGASRHDDAATAPQVERAALNESAHDFATAGNVVFVTGAIVLAVGAAWGGYDLATRGDRGARKDARGPRPALRF